MPTPQLKMLNKHNIIHIVYIEMDNFISNLTNKGSNIALFKHSTHAHTHTRQKHSEPY